MAEQSQDNSSISINANSSANAGNNNADENGVFYGYSRLQTPEEFIKDKNLDYYKDDNLVNASGVDELPSNSYGAAATDKAGTAGRKRFGDTELSKGLEAQAKDEEGV